MTNIWAHRGASGQAPENTIPAFELAIAQGAHGVEFDVQRTKDGQLVVIHDETIDRTSNGNGSVVTQTLAELRKYDYANGVAGYSNIEIPTLAEVLEILLPSQLKINIELKNSVELYPEMEFEVVNLVSNFGLSDRVIISSFNHYSLPIVQQLSNVIELGALYECAIVDPWIYAKRLNISAIHPHFLALRVPGFVNSCHEHGIAINTWTVNDIEQANWLIELGVDSLITNCPEKLLGLLDKD